MNTKVNMAFYEKMPGEHCFVVDDYAVPFITGRLTDGENRWNIILDGRFCFEIDHQDLQKFLWFVSHAMAVAAGYPKHGSGEKINRHAVRVGAIDIVETDDHDH